MRTWLTSIVLMLTLAPTSFAQPKSIAVEIGPSPKEGRETPICVPLSLPAEFAKVDEIDVYIDLGGDARPMPTRSQLTAPSLTTARLKPTRKDLVRRDLHVVLPRVPANQAIYLDVRLEKVKPQVDRFAWVAEKDGTQHAIFTQSGSFNRTLRYMNFPFDDSTKAARDKSYKVFHHLFDPAGKHLVTNGGFADDFDGDPKKLLFPHHRGIMYGFNRCSYGPDLKKKADTWHCTGDAYVSQEKTLAQEAGPILARHRNLIHWHGQKKEVFAIEERELTIYHIPGGHLVEFASLLKTAGDKVRLDGDPQHAGFQFRAHNDVAAKTAKETYYLRPDGKGGMGETRNWDPKTKKGPVDLPWYAMSFVLGDQRRYTVCYLNPPSNPKQTRFSERDYGRFGGYFEYDLTEQNPLLVNYRLWLQDGEMTGEQAQALWAAFATPPSTKVK